MMMIPVRYALYGAGAGLLAIPVVVLLHVTAPADAVVQGQVEVTRVNVSAKIAGRLDSLLVREGDVVEAGAVVAVLRTPELDARARQADAALAAAAAQEAKARRGARREEIAAAEANWERARTAEQLAAVTHERVERLFAEGVVAEQRRDEAQAQWAAAVQAAVAARAQYEMALEGARAEDRAAAAALVRQAAGGRAEVEAYAAERRVTAPIGGEVVQRNSEPGEVVAAGLPILVIADAADAWVTFNVREDRLARIPVGDTLTVTIPALGHRAVVLRISFLAPLADFATWRATAETGGFDVRTFEVRGRPVERQHGLRAGMSALVRADRLDHR